MFFIKYRYSSNSSSTFTFNRFLIFLQFSVQVDKRIDYIVLSRKLLKYYLDCSNNKDNNSDFIEQFSPIAFIDFEYLYDDCNIFT